MSYLNLVGVGDCLAYLATIPDNSVDSCCTDAPYGLGKAPDPALVMAAWCRGETIEIDGAGFMGKSWDAFVPQPDVWREVCRVLKPGGLLVCFFGTRTYDWGVMAIRFGGFEVLDQLEWLYGSGMPKNLNLGEATGEEAWKGWGSALSPAHEPIVLARKPMPGKLTDNVRDRGTGGLNIDAGRLPTEDGRPGRWPSNILLDEEAGAQLDEQSGVSKSCAETKTITRKTSSSTLWSGMGQAGNQHEAIGYGDSGGASRFFYSAKARQASRWAYCKQCELVFTHDRERFAEHDAHKTQVVSHPTQKPLALMEYLVALVTQPGGVVLDPYCGTGTTALAAKRGGFNFITCDLSPSYAAIARVRLAADESTQRDELGSGAHLCPGCKADNTLTLIERTAIERARLNSRKVVCMVCMQRFDLEHFSGKP